MWVALAGISMMFTALTSAYIVRANLANDWRPIAMPRLLWLSTALIVASSFTFEIARRDWAGDRKSAPGKIDRKRPRGGRGVRIGFGGDNEDRQGRARGIFYFKRFEGRTSKRSQRLGHENLVSKMCALLATPVERRPKQNVSGFMRSL